MEMREREFKARLCLRPCGKVSQKMRDGLSKDNSWAMKLENTVYGDQEAIIDCDD